VRIFPTVGWTADDWDKRTDGYRECLQAGPLLLVDGKSVGGSADLLGKSRDRQFLWSRKTISPFVCLDASHVPILGFSDATMQELLDYITKKDGVACRFAIRLTGGQSGGLIGSDPYEVKGNDAIRLPNAILIVDR